MKLEEEATNAGAAVVLLATAGGSPLPIFFFFLNTLLVSSSFLRLDGKGSNKNMAYFSFCMQKKGSYAKEDAGNIQKLLKKLYKKISALNIT